MVPRSVLSDGLHPHVVEGSLPRMDWLGKSHGPEELNLLTAGISLDGRVKRGHDERAVGKSAKPQRRDALSRTDPRVRNRSR